MTIKEKIQKAFVETVAWIVIACLDVELFCIKVIAAVQMIGKVVKSWGS